MRKLLLAILIIAILIAGCKGKETTTKTIEKPSEKSAPTQITGAVISDSEAFLAASGYIKEKAREKIITGDCTEIESGLCLIPNDVRVSFLDTNIALSGNLWIIKAEVEYLPVHYKQPPDAFEKITDSVTVKVDARSGNVAE